MGADALCATRMQSPLRIWPLAMRLDKGWTSKRSMARFNGRAPYLTSVLSINKKSRALSVTLIKNRVPA